MQVSGEHRRRGSKANCRSKIEDNITSGFFIFGRKLQIQSDITSVDLLLNESLIIAFRTFGGSFLGR
jgi:hypothetical protein